ncbi:methylamine utilization protein [Methylovorus menthalis]|uniref:methylamine utilization protein n=1 Tax=Methylovorus menthalis TaxID=1002227 RepID=UPI001E5FA97A|nr:methylamine utilization protein [Methylovorus menthalis]MCB4810941.1 methylamine utilization protein [Methylovorus menthalis]
MQPSYSRFFFRLLTLAPLLFSCSVHAAELTVNVTDAAGSPLPDAVVYAEPTGKAPVTAIATAAIEQKNRQFYPLVSVIQTGASVTFPNRDKVKHHVYSFSPAKTFELKLYSGIPSTPVIFDKAGTVVLGCNIHDQMLAFIRVVDTPYFALSDSTGKATISNLPNGPYTLKTWHYAQSNENTVAEKSLTIKADEQAAVKLDINTSALQKR